MHDTTFYYPFIVLLSLLELQLSFIVEIVHVFTSKLQNLYFIQKCLALGNEM